MRLEPGRQLDRYRVEELLGEGGFSVVHRVRHLALDRAFALKVLKADRSDLHVRLLAEGRVQAKLEHPHVVAVRDVIDVDGSPGLILDLVEGGSLDRLLDRYRPSIDEIDRMGRGILEGVAAAHALGLVHRDLKPSNVLLEETSAGLVPKVSDFGLARALLPETSGFGASGTRSGVLMGTPAYMAPEQIESPTTADARSDIFSLGSLLYELACGLVAFDGRKLADVLFYVANVRYRPIEGLVPDLPDRMRLAIEGALQERPGDRHQTVEEMLGIWKGDATPVSRPSRTIPVFVHPPPPGPRRVVGGAEPTYVVPLLRRMVIVAALTAAASAVLVILLFGLRPSTPEPGLTATSPMPAVAVEPPWVDAGPPAPTGPSEAATGRARAEPLASHEPEVVGASVEVVGQDVERAQLVRRADGRSIAAGGGVPEGLYDVLVWFVDEPRVLVSLGLRVRDGERWTVTCDAGFYTCSAGGAP